MVSCEESAEVLEFWEYNKTNLGPNFLQTAECPPPEWLPLLIIAGVMWLATLIVTLVSTSRFDSYRWSKTFIHVMTRRVLYYYVLYSLLNVFVILNAKGTLVYTYLGDVLEALCFLNFYMLIWSYTGGIEQTMKKMIGLELNLGQPPFCWLCCFPNIKISERFLWWMEKLLQQLPGVQGTVGLIYATLVSSGVSATIFQHWATTTLYIIMTVSFMFSMYAIGILFACLSQFVVGRSIRAKFAVFKITIVLAKVQGIILSLCSSSVDTHGYYSKENRTDMWNAFIVCVECLVLSIVANFLYKKSDYDTGPLAPVRYKKDVDEIDGLGSGMEEVDLGKPSLVIQNPNI